MFLSTCIPILQEHDLFGGRIEPKPTFEVSAPPQLVLIGRIQEGVSCQCVVGLGEFVHVITSKSVSSISYSITNGNAPLEKICRVILIAE